MPGKIGAGAFWTGMVDLVGGKSPQDVATDIQKSLGRHQVGRRSRWTRELLLTLDPGLSGPDPTGAARRSPIVMSA